MTRSQMCSLSCASEALYFARAERIAIRPHSEHSFSATSSLLSTCESMMNTPCGMLAELGVMGDDEPADAFAAA